MSMTRSLARSLSVVVGASALLLAPAVMARDEAAAPAAAAAAAAVTAAPAGSGPGLWVVRDADSTLYLFGTVHVLKPETPWATARVDTAFASADEYWFELADLEDVAGAMPIIQAKGISPDRPLSSLLTAEEFAALDVAARTVGVTAAQLDPLRPWFASLQLALASITKAGYVVENGGDRILHARAAATGKPIKGLESMAQQVGFLADMDEATQLAMLRSSLTEFDQAEVVLDQMVTAWATGDVDGIDRLLAQKMESDSPEMYEVMLSRRNTDWANQIQTMLAGSGTVFISVGAGHLAGDDSVQAELEERGVKVERILD